jgi:Family of unknown function (DUF6058)
MAFAGELTKADVAYVRDNYVSLADLCGKHGISVDEVHARMDAGLLPKPAYVLPDGTEMVAADYFGLADAAGGAHAARAYFEAGFRKAAAAEGLAVDAEVVEAEWHDYLTGAYAVCLRDVTPENMARKTALVERISALLDRPEEDDPAWRSRLRDAVDGLDGLERPFSPDRDRRDPPSRVRLIEEPRRRFPEAFP